MSTTVETAIRDVRALHPLFTKDRVPDASFARFWTNYQRTLIAKGVQRNRDFITQNYVIGFDIQDGNRYGTAGVTAGRFAVQPTTPLAERLEPTGLATIYTGTTYFAEVGVVAATATTIEGVGAAWTVNEHTGRIVTLIVGPGAGQQRLIASNTSNVLMLTQALATLPVAGSSLFSITDSIQLPDEDFGLVLSAPFVTDRVGYKVFLNASGAPIIDVINPVTAKVASGLPLPPHQMLVGGDLYFEGGDHRPEGLNFVGYGQRHDPKQAYSCYVQNGKLFLLGDESEWGSVLSCDLRYVPIAPELTALADLFLLPDDAMYCLIAGAAHHAAMRVSVLEGRDSVDSRSFSEAKLAAEQTWMTSLSVQKRNRTRVIRSW